MQVWIDLANSPHVAVFEPVVERLRAEGSDVLLTARDHAQTAELAKRTWPETMLIGGESPAGRAAKGAAVAHRAHRLWRVAVRARPAVAVSHGSYAQILAARLARVPAVTLMDYEFQPANHLSFRLAGRVIVPEVFPSWALRRYGAGPEKVVRYPGFKEELYVDRSSDPDALRTLPLDPKKIIVVMRPPPDEALYHRFANSRFDDLLASARSRADTQVVLLPRTRSQAGRYEGFADLLTVQNPVDGRALVRAADLVIGAGGTMNREAALLATPAYTIFGGPLAAVDAELVKMRLMHDLRDPTAEPVFAKKKASSGAGGATRGSAILETIAATVAEVAGHRSRSR